MRGSVKFILYIIALSLGLLYVIQYNSGVGMDPSEEVTSAIKKIKLKKRDCKRHDSFAFIKTHKTGSSTMSNILLRFTETHGLNQLMGKYPSSTEYHNLLNHNYPPTPDGGPYHGFAMHAAYNYEFLREKLAPDAKFFTFIRHPVSRYISAFNFFGKSNVYDVDDFNHAVHLHLQKNAGYMKTTYRCTNCNFLIDNIATDLGFDFKAYFEAPNREAYFSSWLAVKDEQLEFVLLTEQFDLSLVLLARKMCWSLEDVAYLKSLESIRKPEVEEDIKAKILEVQRIDAGIYEYYNRTFWQHVAREEGIWEEVEELRRINAEMATKCIAGREKAGQLGAYQLVLTPFGKTNFTCKAMVSRVLVFGKLIQKRNEGLRDEEQGTNNGYLSLQDLYNVRYGES